MSRTWLIIRFKAAGDVVMAAWVAASIKAQFPDDQIDFAVEAGQAPLLDQQRLFRQIIPFAAKKDRKGAPSGYLNLFRAGRYDFVIDLHGQSKTALALAIAHGRRKLSIYSSDLSVKVLCRFRMTKKRKDIHKMEQFLAVLREVEPNLEIPKSAILPVGTLPDELHNRKFITISTAAGGKKKLVEPKALDEAAHILQREGYNVITLGANGDRAIEGVPNFVVPWQKTLAILQSSLLHISGDTGPAHMAAALNRPTLTIFVNGDNRPHEFRPWGELATVLDVTENPNALTGEMIAQRALEILKAGAFDGN